MIGTARRTGKGMALEARPFLPGRRPMLLSGEV